MDTIKYRPTQGIPGKIAGWLIFSAALISVHAITLRGTLTDKTTGSPIGGALVSAGHSIYRTTTDTDGKFAIDVPQSAVKHSGRIALKPGRVHWNIRSGMLTLSGMNAFNSLSVYTTNGVRIASRTLSPFSGTITLPRCAAGVYYLVFTGNNHDRCAVKALVVPGGNDLHLTLPGTISRTTVSAALPFQGRLLFRHDDYYPLDSNVTVSDNALGIGMKADPRGSFFGTTRVHTMKFTLTNEDSLSMEKNALDEKYSRAECTINDTLFGTVGLRYKGSDFYSMPRCFDKEGNRSSYADCRNVSLKVKFNKFTDTARFLNMKRLNLHSMSYDEGKLREMLAYRMFRDMGIYTCRTVFVKVYVNDVFRGLFTAVEAVDGRFTKSRWPEYGNGNLFKEAWPFRTLVSYYRDALETNDKPDDTIPPIRLDDLYKAVKSSTKETFVEKVSPFIDCDYWLNYIVVDRAIHNADGIMTWYSDGSWLGNHNFFIYEEENNQGKAWLIPWDLNVTFHPTDPIIDGYDLPEWNVVPENCEPVTVWGGSEVMPPHCDPLTGAMADALWPQYKIAARKFLATLFTVERLQGQVDSLAALISVIMENEPNVTKEEWLESVADMRKTMTTLHRGFDDYIEDRPISVDSTDFFTTFPADSGFSISLANNFEFSGEVNISEWAEAAISQESDITLTYDTIAPLWGNGSLLSSFSFMPANPDKSYTEWARISFSFGKQIDLSSLSTLAICLQCDAPRTCRIELESEIYDRHNINDRYGWQLRATRKNKQFSLNAEDLAYPDWADTDNPALLDSVLTTVTGITLDIGPQYDTDGQLEFTPDSGFVKIDNITFIRE